MTPIPGMIVARRFQLLNELGHGTMGTVWLAQHMTLGLPCAVKFTSTEAERDPAYRERFEREARAVAQLNSPYVVRILDYDVHEGMPFLAMEWLAGEDLETRLRRVGRLAPLDVHRIVWQVAQGLARAHAAGIIHRDLKPGNIFLAQDAQDGPDGAGEVAKLVDFGLAKVTTSTEKVSVATQAGSVLGTPAYMSPEQARSAGEIDHRSDLWSLAAIAYECLLGKLPFDGPSLGAVFAQVMFEPLPVPSQVDPRVPPAFDAWWARAASRDVEQRFDGAIEMADALEVALALAPGETPAATPALSSLQLASRRPTSAAASAGTPSTAGSGSVEASSPLVGPEPAARDLAPGLVAREAASPDLAVSQTVRPPARRRRSRWPMVLSAAALALVGAIALPRQVLPSVSAPANLISANLTAVEGDLRWAVDSITRAASHVGAPAEAAPSPPTPAPPSIALPVAPALSTGVNRAAVPTPAAKTPSKVAAAAQPPAGVSPIVAAAEPSSLAPQAPSALPTPAPSTDDSVSPASNQECNAEQHRCAGRVLQVCSDDRDGWTDVVDCGEAVCDATGAGACR